MERKNTSLFSELKIPNKEISHPKMEKSPKDGKDYKKAILEYISTLKNDVEEDNIRSNPETWNLIRKSEFCANCLYKKCRQEQKKFKNDEQGFKHIHKSQKAFIRNIVKV